MPTAHPSLRINEELARRINHEARANPQSPYAGKFIGIANGQVVVVADSLSVLGRQMDELPYEPGETYCVEASRDCDKVYTLCLRPDWLTWNPSIGWDIGPMTSEG